MKTEKRILSLLLAVALLLSTSLTVFAETVLAIDIATLPTKLTYTEGESLDVTGGELTVYYSGGQKTIPITEDMVTGFDSTVTDTQTLTVSYAGVTCTYDVLITPKPASAISVTTLPTKLTYLEGKDTLDVTGGELTVSYHDGTPAKTIPMTLDMVTGFDNTTVGAQTLTVTYAEQTTTFRVEIQAKTLAKLTLAQAPTKTTYLLGEEVLDITGGQIRLLYNNDTSEIVDITADMVSGFDGNTAGVQTITVAYGGLTTTYQIEVFETEVVSISVAELPAVTKYLLNTDNVDVTGGEITVKYYNNTTATIPMTAEMISGFDNTVLGKQPLTVTYAEKTTTFTVEICQNNTTEFLGGLGTANRPYIIKTKEHLDHVRNYLNAHYMMIADIEFTEADFAEGGAFYNDGAGWQPIRTFNGSFDGNGHTIKGLQIKITGSSTVYAGLFGYVEKCTIQNLGMVDSCIKVTSTPSSSVAGGIVGYAYSGTISDCYNTGSVTASSTSRSSYAGGIVGEAYSSTITDCYNIGSVTASATSTSSSSHAYAGGIVGETYSGTTITNCYNTDIITATASFSHAYAGGIVGEAYSGTTITNCYNTGIITAKDGFSHTGGIAGCAESSTITNCYYLNIIGKGIGSGTDTATACTAEQMKQQTTFAGFDFETVWIIDDTGEYPLPTLRGLAYVIKEEDTVNFAGGNGSFLNPYRISNNEHLNNVRNQPGCFFKLVADIVFTEEDFDEGGAFYNDNAGWEPIGTSSAPFSGYFDGNGHTIKGLQISITGSSTVYAGLFGYLQNCTIKNLGMMDSCIEVTVTSMRVYAGGIVGVANYATITNCYNTGSVSATSTSAHSFAGGIVGHADENTTITDCYNTGSVSADDYTGGITGYAYDIAISGCYNTGSITATATADYDTNVGGIVGEANCTTITNCYNTGNVTATASYTYSGGIAGGANSTTTIINCYNTGSVSAFGYAGGIVGFTYIVTITNCYNVGIVIANTDAGGIVGEVYSDATNITITDCYYLNIIGKGVGSGADAATACTDEEMKQQATFAGFDFETVWTMEGHEDFLFPELQTVPMVFTDSVVDVRIATLPDKLTFAEGVSLDVSGGMLKVSYSGGRVLEVPLLVSMVTGFDNSAPGKQILTVTYEGKTTTYTVTVAHSYETEWSQDETYHWHACSACGDKTDKTEHVYDNTCDTTCNVCGYTRTITHNFGDWVVTKEPTCTEKGEETRTCATCGKTETREVEALGHDYKDTVTDPTCTEQGYTTHTCTRCNDSYADSYADALGHRFGQWVSNGDATEEKDGTKTRTCSVCGFTETETDVGSMLPATPWVNPYTDVKESAWYYDSVAFATQQGLFNGTSATTFGPNDEMTRAMFVTVLYRLDGSPAIDGGTHFTDIFVDAYYYDAVKWANANGIVYGTDADKFSPDASVTREQMVTFLYRYANYKGVDTGYEASLAAFTDANSVSDYALHAMAWSVGADVIHGSDGMLLPSGTATRAEVATMLKNYVLCVIEK